MHTWGRQLAKFFKYLTLTVHKNTLMRLLFSFYRKGSRLWEAKQPAQGHPCEEGRIQLESARFQTLNTNIFLDLPICGNYRSAKRKCYNSHFIIRSTVLFGALWKHLLIRAHHFLYCQRPEIAPQQKEVGRKNNLGRRWWLFLCHEIVDGFPLSACPCFLHLH